MTEELHSVQGLGFRGAQLFHHQLMMFCEHHVSVSNHHMQQVPVLKYSDVLALLFCTSERRALTGFLTVHSFDKLLSCRRITMGPPGPRVIADNLADNHASDAATYMKPWQQQHTQTSPTHLCAGPPIGTYGTLQNLSAHPAIADGEAVVKSGAQTCRSMTI